MPKLSRSARQALDAQNARHLRGDYSPRRAECPRFMSASAEARRTYCKQWLTCGLTILPIRELPASLSHHGVERAL